MNENNPFAPPRSRIDSAPAADAGAAGHTPTLLWHLGRTRPWVMLLGILGFIYAGLVVLVAVVMIIVGLSQIGSYTGAGEVAMLAGLGLGYLLMAAISFALSAQLVGYGRRIGLATQTGRTEHVEQAVDLQRRFWKTLGIVTIALIGLGLVLFTAGIVLAAVMAM